MTIKHPLLIFTITVLTFFAFLPSFTRLQELKAKNSDYQLRIEALKQQNHELELEKQRLLEDPVYLEKVGRERMGLIREGEVVYRIVTPEDMPEKEIDEPVEGETLEKVEGPVETPPDPGRVKQ